MGSSKDDPETGREPGSIRGVLRSALRVETAEDHLFRLLLFGGAVLLVYLVVNEIMKLGLPDLVDFFLLASMGPLAAGITVAVLVVIDRRSR